jgi:hypothetical protein
MINKILLFLLLLFLPTQLGKHFFFPFSYLSGVRVDYLAPTIYLTDIFILLLTYFYRKTVLNFFRNKKIVIGLFLLLINVVFSKLPIISFYRLIKIVELLIIFSLSKKILTTLKEKNILIIFLISGVFELILSIIQLVYKHSIQGIFYYFGERLLSLSTPGVAKATIQGVEFLRPYGTFSHPNSLAGYFLLLYFFVLTNNNFNRYLTLKYLFLFTSTILVFISFSKITIGCYLILNTYYLISNTKFDCRFCKIARLVGIFAISLIFLSAKTDPLTVQKRIELFRNSFSIILSYPVFGVGLGSYLIEQVKYPSNYYLFFNQPVHNIFMLFFSELGIVIGGILIFISLSPIRKIIKLGPYLILVITLTGFFDHYWFTLQQNYLLIGVLIGMTLSQVVSDH